MKLWIVWFLFTSAMISNLIAGVPQLGRLYKRKSSDDISVWGYSLLAWKVSASLLLIVVQSFDWFIFLNTLASVIFVWSVLGLTIYYR